MEEGPKYAISKEGLLKFIVLLFGCTTWALFADSNGYHAPDAKTWAFAAYIITWSISLLLYFFHVTGLARSMNCGAACSFTGFDFLWSWISTIHVLAISITFATHIGCDVSSNTKYCSEQAGSIALGFATCLLYGVEAYFLRSYAPSNAGYIASLRGWLKTSLLVGGAASFGLLVDSGYDWCKNRSCESGMLYALVVYCIAWSVTLLIFFGNMFLPKEKSQSKPYSMFQFGWSALSAVLFVTASSCFAGYMNCTSFESERCSKRLAGVIFGFITAVLYVVDAIVNKPSS